MPKRLLLLFAMTACAPQPNGTPAASPADAAAETTIVGTVRVVGSLPVSTDVIVDDGAGRSTSVRGALAQEIGGLSGARVEVRGRGDGRVIEATDYEIRSVDGRPVVAGTVERVEAGTVHLRTRAGELVQVTGTTGAFRVGQRIWVQGPQTIRLQSYGIVRQ